MLNEMNLKIATVLKTLMENDRHSLASLVKATGVPKSTISDWLTNRSPNPLQAAKVAKCLGVSLHFLLFGEEDSSEPFQKFLKEEVFSGIYEINIKKIKIKN